ncbi:C-C chemokine receptor type 6-like [Gouania willdenowi]|nr:C-C chemokine receptor type 6-like [Gouania willdenowi]
MDYFDDEAEPCLHGDGPEWMGPVVAGVVSVLGLLGNGVVVVSCALYRGVLPLMDVFLLNVALSDLLLVLALPLLAYNEQWAWPMGTAACKLLHCCYSISLYSGALLLACVSIDRYIAVVRSHRSLRLRTPWYGRVVCGTMWAAALLLSVPTAVFYARYETLHTDNLTEFVCEFSFSHEDQAKMMKIAVPATQLAIGFFLPLCVMAFCYTAIALTLTRAVFMRRRRAVLLVLVVLAVFVLCHLPYNVVLLHNTAAMFEQDAICEKINTRRTALRVTEGVAYLHCCLNPPLYAFSSQRFRTRLYAAMRRLQPANHSSPSDHTPQSGHSNTASCTM